ncbi:MAG: hypothetical protein QXP39_02575 [Candidatus Aenigmatarchaeota archaeon]
MISIFQLFRIIFGLIISFFILYFITSYLTTYIGIQSASMQAQALRSFSQTLQHVYTYNDPQTFDEFKKTGLNFTVITLKPDNRPVITTELGDWEMPVPALIRPGQELWLERKGIDWGWYEFWFVVGVPKDFLFIINDQTSGDLFRKIEPYLPGNTTKYANCDGADIDEPKSLSWFSIKANANKCLLKPGKNQALITISNNCDQSYQQYGLCIHPQGIAYISNQSISWADGLDILAITLGANHDDFWGPLSPRLYDAKQYFFNLHVSIAANSSARRAERISTYIQNLISQGRISSTADVAKCVRELNNFKSNLTYISTYPTFALLEHSKSIYENLLMLGCEVRE